MMVVVVLLLLQQAVKPPGRTSFLDPPHAGPAALHSVAAVAGELEECQLPKPHHHEETVRLLQY
jgi:hypothetical protein